jgi:hypothetical protein
MSGCRRLADVAGLRSLGTLPSLTALSLCLSDCASLTELDALRSLAGVPALQSLKLLLAGSSLRSLAWLKSLAGIRGLRYLALDLSYSEWSAGSARELEAFADMTLLTGLQSLAVDISGCFCMRHGARPAGTCISCSCKPTVVQSLLVDSRVCCRGERRTAEGPRVRGQAPAWPRAGQSAGSVARASPDSVLQFLQPVPRLSCVQHAILV